MYHAVWQDKFRDVIDLSGNKFEVENSEAARRKLAMYINDNVYKNLSKLSTLGYDKDMSRHKSQFSCPEKKEIVEDLINETDIKDQLKKSVDRILATHRNTKLFLFLMSGPFFVLISLIKYSLKVAIMYYVYKKGKS